MALELLHQAALIPALAVVVFRPRDAGALLIALAFLTSWVGDAIAWGLGGAWAGFYAWVPVQVAFALAAVLKAQDRVLAIVGLVVVSLYSIVLSFPGPEVMVIALGSVVIVWNMPHRFRWPLGLYFGCGTAFYLAMLAGDFMTFWYPYQVCRLAAFGSFGVLMFREKGKVHAAIPH